MTTDNTIITFETRGPITLGTITGTKTLDGLHVEEFGRDACDFVMGKPGLNLMLDFRNVTYLSSAALTELGNFARLVFIGCYNKIISSHGRSIEA